MVKADKKKMTKPENQFENSVINRLLEKLLIGILFVFYVE